MLIFFIIRQKIFALFQLPLFVFFIMDPTRITFSCIFLKKNKPTQEKKKKIYIICKTKLCYIYQRLFCYIHILAKNEGLESRMMMRRRVRTTRTLCNKTKNITTTTKTYNNNIEYMQFSTVNLLLLLLRLLFSC